MHRSLTLGLRGILLVLVVFGLAANLSVFGTGIPVAKKNASGDIRSDVAGNDGSIEVAQRARRCNHRLGTTHRVKLGGLGPHA